MKLHCFQSIKTFGEESSKTPTFPGLFKVVKFSMCGNPQEVRHKVSCRIHLGLNSTEFGTMILEPVLEVSEVQKGVALQPKLKT